MRSILKPKKRTLIAILTLLIIILGIPVSYDLAFSGKIYPNTAVAGVNVGKLKPEDAVYLLSQEVKVPEKITLVSESKKFDIPSKDVELSYDFSESVQRAYGLTRTGNIFFDFYEKFKLLKSPQDIGLSTKLNEEKVNKIVSVIAGQVSEDPVFPSAKIENKEVVINKGKAGTEVDPKLLRALAGRAFSFAKEVAIEIPTEKVDPSINDEGAKVFKARAEKFLGKNLEIKFEFRVFSYPDSKILELLAARGGLSEESLNEVGFKIASEINRAPQEPKFNFTEGKVVEFQPATDGIELDQDKLKQKITEEIDALENSEEKTRSFDAPVKRTPPETTTDKVNNLGIKELIGRGTSRFRGSIPSRVHNVVLASSRLNGILIKPGDTFSFNDALGDVSQFTGYQQAYVIREGKTVLGDGGGVCQVSTTFFRAALNAGLPILERQAHAYRVGYYEQDGGPGLDATVYGPTPDLKIKNDTPAHVLITAKADPKNYTLVFEFYGTSDGRVATITKPIVSGVTAPGDDLYIDDPTLPAGTIKQTEHRAYGARVTFNYLVQRAGEVVYKKTFLSSYRPWQAVYLRGTGPVQ